MPDDRATETVPPLQLVEEILRVDAVDRDPADGETVPPPREVDGVMIISVVEERLRVVRELVLVEEVHMREVRTSEPFEQTVSRRVMRAVVERYSTEQGD